MSRELFLVLALATLAGAALHSAWGALLGTIAPPAEERLEVSPLSSLHVAPGRGLITLVVRNGGSLDTSVVRVEMGRGSCKGNLTLGIGESAVISCTIKGKVEVGQIYEVRICTSSDKCFKAFLRAEEER